MARYSQVEPLELGNFQDPKGNNGRQRTGRHREGMFHWRASLLMVGSGLIGIAFAVGHHAFYSHYNGRAVTSEQEQRYIISVGTAFAFLVKVFLTLATATAYVQNFWMRVKRRPNSVQELDALNAVLRNPLHFWNIRMWSRHMVLLVLALITWFIPITAVITPGTMTVQPQLQNSTVLTRPPQLPKSWSGNSTYATSEIDTTAMWTSGGPDWCGQNVVGPKSELLGLALASASQQNIVPVSSTFHNSTYTLELFGPAVQCDAASAADVSAFNQSLTTANNDWSINDNSFVTDIILLYNAWVPQKEVKFTNGTDAGFSYNLTAPDWNNATSSSGLISPFLGPTTVNGDSAGPKEGQALNKTTSPATDGSTLYVYVNGANNSGMALLTCKLHNASYTVDFQNLNSDKSVKIKNVSINEYILPYGEWIDCNNPDYTSQSYNAMMEAFNTILVGHGLNGTALQGSNGYSQAAFKNTLVGVTSLNDFIQGNRPTTDDAIKGELEQLFQNMTISMYSSKQFILPEDQSPQISVALQRTVNVFSYRPKYLFVAYGAGIASMVVCVALGILAMLKNHGSYSNDFSTVLRTTRRQELQDVVPHSERGGEAPIPQSLNGVRLRLIAGTGAAGDGFAIELPAFASGVADRHNDDRKFASEPYASRGLMDSHKPTAYAHGGDIAVDERSADL